MNGLEKAQHIQTAKDAEIKRFTIGKVDSRKKIKGKTGQLFDNTSKGVKV